MQTFTYEEIREKALKQGVTEISGAYTMHIGYIKSKRKIQGKVITVYSIPQMQFN